MPPADRPRDVGPLLVSAVVVMVVVVAVTLRVLFLDLAQTGSPPPAPFVVVGTPTTYGPPPW